MVKQTDNLSEPKNESVMKSLLYLSTPILTVLLSIIGYEFISKFEKLELNSSLEQFCMTTEEQLGEIPNNMCAWYNLGHQRMSLIDLSTNQNLQKSSLESAVTY